MVGRILGLRKTELGDRPNLATELGGASSIAAGDARARSLTGLPSRSIGFPMIDGPRSAGHGAKAQRSATLQAPFQGRHVPMARIALNVNGSVHTIDADPDMPLLYALRNDLNLNNPHFGCGLAQCGACTVHIDGEAVRSCVTPLSAVGNGNVVTLAGLGTPEKPHPIQKAYVDEQVPQCGYCINGWIMTAAALLNRNKKPTDAQIKDALTGLKCRCGTHMSIMRAVKRAAEMMG
jgi:nicotinate dehydrogenase subunit A